MRTHFLLLSTLVLSMAASAQALDDAIAGQRLSTQIIVAPTYQRFVVNGQSITQTSVPMSAYVPVGRNWAFAARIATAQARGDTLAGVSGLSDAQLHLSHYRPIGRASIVFSVQANLPTGKQRLTPPEFGTLVLLSQDQFNFATPALGVGASVSPGVTFAFPLTRTFVAGLGAAYNLRGSFEPLAAMAAPYAPGDELLLTAGFDWRPSRSLTLWTDVSFTRYAADQVGKEDVFVAGEKVVASLQLQHVHRFNDAHLVLRYRSRASSSFLGATATQWGGDTTMLPNQLDVVASYRARLSEVVAGSIRAQVRRFEASALLPGVRQIYGMGGGAEIELARSWGLSLHLRYHLGDLSGVEALGQLSLRM